VGKSGLTLVDQCSMRVLLLTNGAVNKEKSKPLKNEALKQFGNRAVKIM
jgi:hypothetical protein